MQLLELLLIASELGLGLLVKLLLLLLQLGVVLLD